MRNKIFGTIVVLLLCVCFSGCAIKTQGKGSWEIYAGVRTNQESPEPAIVSVESDLVESLTDEE